MNNEFAPEFKEYLAEYQLQKPPEVVVHYQDGELEAEWLVAAGFPQLTVPFEEGRELHTSELEPVLSSLPKEHAEAINQRVRALNKTVRGRSRHRYRRKPDIRDVFRDVDSNGAATRSRSATPDSLDSIPPAEVWDNTHPSVIFDHNTSTPEQEKQLLQRVPSEPLRGSAELFRGSNIRCDLPFFMPEGIELVGFQKIGTVHIPRVRSGSDPSCSIGRERGSIIAASRSDNNLLSDSPPHGSFLDEYSSNSPGKEEVFVTTQPVHYAQEATPISFENMCRQTSEDQVEWNPLNEPHVDVNDINEIELKKFQQYCWLELASIFDRHQVVLDKRKPFKRKRKEEGNLFGVSLNALIRRDQQVTGEDSTMVPLIIQIILEELRRRGAKEEGILRLAGHRQKTENLYNELEATFYQNPDRAGHLLSMASVHDLSALLKRLLRDLPQPLLANDLIHLFYQTHCIRPPDQYKALSMLCLLLPHENRNTVRDILSFLNYIIDKQDMNKMNKHNVATIFAPSFFPPRFIHPVDINDIESQVKMAAACCDLTKVLISQAELLFMVPKRMLDQARASKGGHNKKIRDHDRMQGSKMGNAGHVHRIII